MLLVLNDTSVTAHLVFFSSPRQSRNFQIFLKFHFKTKWSCGYLGSNDCIVLQMSECRKVAQIQLIDFAEIFCSMVTNILKNFEAIKIPKLEFQRVWALANVTCWFQTLTWLPLQSKCKILKKGFVEEPYIGIISKNHSQNTFEKSLMDLGGTYYLLENVLGKVEK